MAKFSLPHYPGPQALPYQGPEYSRRYYQSLMYAGLRTSDLYIRNPVA